MPSQSDIESQIERICASSALDGAPLRRAFLRYIFQQTFSDKPATERSIAIAVYKCDPETFDPAIDSIVRVEKGKLADLIQEYYETEGRNAPVRVTIHRYQISAEYTAHYIPPVEPDTDPGPDPDEGGTASLDDLRYDSGVERLQTQERILRKHIDCSTLFPSEITRPVKHETCPDAYYTRLNARGQFQLPDRFVQWILDAELRDAEQSPNEITQAKYAYVMVTMFETKLRIYPRRKAINMAQRNRYWSLPRNTRGVYPPFKLADGSAWICIGKQGYVYIPSILRKRAGLTNKELVVWWPNDNSPSGRGEYMVLTTKTLWQMFLEANRGKVDESSWRWFQC